MKRSTLTNDKVVLARRIMREWSMILKNTAVKTKSRKTLFPPKIIWESFCFNIKSTMEDDNIKDKISESDKNTVMEKCNEKELEGICNPIITKLYQGAGRVPLGMPGGVTGVSEEQEVLHQGLE
ncbi:hypothetical protein WA026_016711, partial [Henosepilachna vigintioctopunctata]